MAVFGTNVEALIKCTIGEASFSLVACMGGVVCIILGLGRGWFLGHLF